MNFTISNKEDVEKLLPGSYCCRIESATWSEIVLRVETDHEHVPGDCLLQVTKEKPPTELKPSDTA